jgi:hypothetical protein
MNADDSKQWALFENRPARERTSSREPSQEHQRGVATRQGRSRVQPARRTVSAERVKC